MHPLRTQRTDFRAGARREGPFHLLPGTQQWRAPSSIGPATEITLPPLTHEIAFARAAASHGSSDAEHAASLIGYRAVSGDATAIPLDADRPEARCRNATRPHLPVETPSAAPLGTALAARPPPLAPKKRRVPSCRCAFRAAPQKYYQNFETTSSCPLRRLSRRAAVSCILRKCGLSASQPSDGAPNEATVDNIAHGRTRRRRSMYTMIDPPLMTDTAAQLRSYIKDLEKSGQAPEVLGALDTARKALANRLRLDREKANGRR
jgi:hypothetical protein